MNARAGQEVADIELLVLEGRRVTPLVSADSGFTARDLSHAEARRIMARWHEGTQPSYALSSSGAIRLGLFDELAAILHGIREERFKCAKACAMARVKELSSEERDIGSLIIYCAARVGRRHVAPIPGWAG